MNRFNKILFKIKYLVLWRHAEAEDAEPDYARPLTDKGRLQAKRMADWLNARLPADALVLASPALRTQQTVKALKRTYTTCDALSTSTDCATLLKAVSECDAETILVVGHQPTLGQVASRLLTGADGELSVKKGAVWWLRMRPERNALAVLSAMMSPDML